MTEAERLRAAIAAAIAMIEASAPDYALAILRDAIRETAE
jgi:hypothetical protein